MSKRFWAAWEWSAYDEDTKDLSMLEHGAYIQLINYYYSNKGPIPANADRLLRACRAFADNEKAAVMYVLDKFFVLDGDVYRQKKCDEVMQKSSQVSEKRSVAGKEGAAVTNAKKAAKRAANDSAKSQQMSTHLQLHTHSQENPPPTPSHETPEPTYEPEFDGQEAFDRLCRVHPKPEQNALAAQKFHEDVEWAMKHRGYTTHQSAANWIIEKAELYSRIADFQYGLITWLDRKIFDQKETAWKSNGRNNVGEAHAATTDVVRNAREQRQRREGIKPAAKAEQPAKLEAGTH